MATGRPVSLVATCDQWVRATHADTAVEGPCGDLTLSWSLPDAGEPPDGGACPARGLATDRLCRIYRLREKAVDRLLVGPTTDGLDYALLPEPVTLIGPGQAPTVGPDFVGPPVEPLGDAVGIAIDGDDRLFIADREARAIRVIDLWSRRLLRSVSVATPENPERDARGLASSGLTVWAVVRRPSGLLRLTAGRGPDEVLLPSGVDDLAADAEPSRVAVLADGEPVLLFHDAGGDGWLVAGARAPRNVGHASDIAVDWSGAVVVAPCAVDGQPALLRRWHPTSDGWIPSHPVVASG
jgi:hypothetical protein